MESIFRVPLTQNSKEFILLQVYQEKHEDPLSLKLVATEGEAVYTTQVTRSDLEKAKSIQNSIVDNEWEAILESIFTKQYVDHVKLVAKVKIGVSVDIFVQRFARDFSTTLGAIVLRQQDDVDPNIVDWCGTAAEEAAKLRQLVKEKDDWNSLCAMKTEEMKMQLGELAKAKEKDEEVLMSKFLALLNEKKARIRELQKMVDEQERIIEERVKEVRREYEEKDKERLDKTDDEEEEEEEEDNEKKKTARKPQATISTRGRGRGRGEGRAGVAVRTRKRKAAVEAESDSDGFQKVDVNQELSSDNDDAMVTESDAGQATTGGEETADEDGGVVGSELEDLGIPIRKETTQNMEVDEDATESEDEEKGKEEEAPPPVRALPFAAKDKEKKKRVDEPEPQPKEETDKMDTGDVTETEDDDNNDDEL